MLAGFLEENEMKRAITIGPVSANRSHAEATVERFRRDPAFGVEYVNSILEDGGQDELLLALRYFASAFGRVTAIARKAELDATSLYKTLSRRGNPELRSLITLLKAMGMRLTIQPARQSPARRSAAGSGGSRATSVAALPRAGSARSPARARARRARPRASRAAA